MEIFSSEKSLRKQAVKLFSGAMLLEISSSSRVTSSLLFVSPQPIHTEINVRLKT